ncbi:MAG TPA: hypothetical protein ENN99_13915 [Chloroflexi bacterium]|nr:hypothetical protein [Chloroflexota bacterium]
MDVEAILVIALCIILGLWYAWGYLYNRHRGQRLFRWLEQGLDVLGGEREAGWLGSPASGARINITRAASPFRRIEITLLITNREFFIAWLLDHLRGSQDWLIIKATLRSPCRGEVEILLTGDRIAKGLRAEQEFAWICQETPRLLIAHRGPGAERQANALKPWLASYEPTLHRLSWRKTDPHIQIQMAVNPLSATTDSSQSFWTDLQNTIQNVTQIERTNK